MECESFAEFLAKKCDKFVGRFSVESFEKVKSFRQKYGSYVVNQLALVWRETLYYFPFLDVPKERWILLC